MKVIGLELRLNFPLRYSNKNKINLISLNIFLIDLRLRTDFNFFEYKLRPILKKAKDKMVEGSSTNMLLFLKVI